jgi:tRNA pseudouridine32 synthase/23S rRNA pseudouridine746 synthase
VVILYGDKRCLVVNKPAGLPVYAGRAGGPSVEDFFPQWRRGRSVSKGGPWLVHRLDQDTAGCLVIALKKAFLLEAQEMFAQGRVQKTYWALVRGKWSAPEGVVEAPLAKVTQGHDWKMAVSEAGDRAVTAWRVLGTDGAVSLVEFTPRTGRTHQVRVHAAHMGHPIVGDAIYGGGAGRLCLLARAISLPTDPPVSVIAPVPEHMRAGVEACDGAL